MGVNSLVQRVSRVEQLVHVVHLLVVVADGVINHATGVDEPCGIVRGLYPEVMRVARNVVESGQRKPFSAKSMTSVNPIP